MCTIRLCWLLANHGCLSSPMYIYSNHESSLFSNWCKFYGGCWVRLKKCCFCCAGEMLSLTSPDRGTRTSIYYQVASVVCMVPTYCFGYPPHRDKTVSVAPGLLCHQQRQPLCFWTPRWFRSFRWFSLFVVGGWVDIWVNG